MVAYVAAGTVTSAAAQTVAPPYPASIAAGDGLILTRAAKPDTAALVTPSGWTLLDERAGGVGVYATDTGPVRMVRYFREATGSETGTVTCDSTPASVDVQMAVITRYTKGTGTAWSVTASGGVDAAAGTDWSVTAAAALGIEPGDLVEVALSWPTDAVRTWTSEVLTATGATLGALTVPLASITTSLGADMAIRLHNYTCSAGTSSAAPTYSAVVNSATNVAGPTTMVRLREVSTGSTGTITATLPAAVAGVTATAEATGTVAATLPAAVAVAAAEASATGQLASTLPAAVTAAVATVPSATVTPGTHTTGGTTPTLTTGATAAATLSAGGTP